jgi:sortase A
VLFLGVVGVGYASVQIYQMRTSAGNQVLPALGPLTGVVVSVATKSTTEPTVNYSPYPKLGDVIGTISLPSLKEKLPIIEGTDDAELKRGVGHFIGSVLPGVSDNSVLAGHRDSVFSNLGKLVLGDPIVVRTITGEFTYTVIKFRIVMATDRTVIVPTPTAILTLSTCYPFRYFGNAPKRYIVSAELTRSELTKA